MMRSVVMDPFRPMLDVAVEWVYKRVNALIYIESTKGEILTMFLCLAMGIQLWFSPNDVEIHSALGRLLDGNDYSWPLALFVVGVGQLVALFLDHDPLRRASCLSVAVLWAWVEALMYQEVGIWSPSVVFILGVVLSSLWSFWQIRWEATNGRVGSGIPPRA